MNNDKRTNADVSNVAPVRDRRRIAIVAVALALVSFAAVTVVSNIDTALARFSASTTNEGSWFEAGAIEISTASGGLGGPAGSGGDPEAERAALAIDAEALAPGRVVERCVVTDYRGSIDGAEVRVFGRRDGGTGLDRYLLTVVEVGTGTDRECTDFERDREVFSGTLSELHDAHGSWPDALVMASSMSSGDSVTMRIAVEVRSDDRAQGLHTEFWLVLEARP